MSCRLRKPVASSSSEPSRKIGILTGGGDCPGLNAVIRAVCATAARLDIGVVGIADGFEGLYNGKTVPLCWDVVTNIFSVGGTILGTTNKGHFVSTEVTPETWEVVKRNWNTMGLECLICIGGDGTMAIADLCSRECGIPVVGVPKTIDNDLRSTDQTFGFDSAVSIVTEAIDRLHTTASSHHRVMVVEVMGRNAGWIALASTIAGGADVCLLPEVQWSFEPVLARLADNAQSARGYSLIVVSEGAKWPGSHEQLHQAGGQLGGIGSLVADYISKHSSMEARLTVLGHTQRGGSPTSFDRILSSRYGVLAAELAVAKDYGKMVSLSGSEIVAVPITSSMGEQRLVALDSQILHSARQLGVIFGDETLPLTHILPH